MPSPTTLSISTPSARFHLTTGVLLEANDSFFEFADLQKDALLDKRQPLTWLGTFGGSLCLFSHSDTRAMVLRSMLLIGALLSRFSRFQEIAATMEVEVLLVTRIGRLHVRLRMLLFHTLKTAKSPISRYLPLFKTPSLIIVVLSPRATSRCDRCGNVACDSAARHHLPWLACTKNRSRSS